MKKKWQKVIDLKSGHPKPGDTLAEIPVEEQEDAYRAYKAAELWITGDSVHLMPVAGGIEHKPEGFAQCAKGRDHMPPQLDCTCGFYAKDTMKEARDYYGGQGVVYLEVDLAGKIIKHELGLRAEHQRILRVTIPGPGHCVGIDCGSKIHQAGLIGSTTIGGMRSFIPICEDYAPRFLERIPHSHVTTTADLTNALGIEVGFEKEWRTISHGSPRGS